MWEIWTCTVLGQQGLVRIWNIFMVPSVLNLEAKLDRFNINNILLMLLNGSRLCEHNMRPVFGLFHTTSRPKLHPDFGVFRKLSVQISNVHCT